eukprot:3553920-Karenia_brevis.AAC.1
MSNTCRLRHRKSGQPKFGITEYVISFVQHANLCPGDDWWQFASNRGAWKQMAVAFANWMSS